MCWVGSEAAFKSLQRNGRDVFFLTYPTDNVFKLIPRSLFTTYALPSVHDQNNRSAPPLRAALSDWPDQPRSRNAKQVSSSETQAHVSRWRDLPVSRRLTALRASSRRASGKLHFTPGTCSLWLPHAETQMLGRRHLLFNFACSNAFKCITFDHVAAEIRREEEHSAENRTDAGAGGATALFFFAAYQWNYDAAPAGEQTATAPCNYVWVSKWGCYLRCQET